MTYKFKMLAPSDFTLFKDLMKLFGEVFEDFEAYQSAKPSENYIQDFLSDNSHIVIVGMAGDQVVGGLVAYELKKFEQERREIYIYDFAISKLHQRKGVGTKLIEHLKLAARKKRAYIIFVQADKNDIGAVNFYHTLSTDKTATYNFDIEL